MDLKRSYRRFSALVFMILVFAAFSAARVTATTPGGQAGAFLRMGLGARAIAMGNAFTGLARDGFSGYYNPGGLPFLQNPEVVASFALLPLDRKLNYLGFATSIRPSARKGSNRPDALDAGMAVGWLNAGVTDIDLRNSNGEHTGMQSSSENAFFFSFALKPLSWLAVGITGKVLYYRLPGLNDDGSALSSTGFGFDLGLFARPLSNLSFGVVIKDLKSKYTWNTEKLWDRGTTTIDYFPKQYRLGMAYQFANNLILAADGEFNEEQGWRWFSGIEWPYKDLLALRVGYNQNRLTFGFGFRYTLWQHSGVFSYAYDTQSLTPGAEQYFTLRFQL